MTAYSPITGLDLPAIAVAAEQLAARVDARTPTPAVRSALGIDQRVRDLRHIAADARSALDGCEASFRSVDEWLEDDSELAPLRRADKPLRSRSMSRARTEHACLKASMDAARIEAWNRFVTDYVGCTDTDPADARARYRADLAAIEQELS